MTAPLHAFDLDSAMQRCVAEVRRQGADEGLPQLHPTLRCYIASDGGVATVTTHGTHHMCVIGQTGARVTIVRHGYDSWRGLVDAKRWQAPRKVSFLADLDRTA